VYTSIRSKITQIISKKYGRNKKKETKLQKDWEYGRKFNPQKVWILTLQKSSKRKVGESERETKTGSEIITKINY
jgi:hypothetical protein